MFKLLKTLPALPGQVEIKTQVAPGESNLSVTLNIVFELGR